MADLDAEQRDLENLDRRINAKINSTPVYLLTDADIIPDFKKKEEEFVQLLEDLDLGITTLCEDHEGHLSLIRYNCWNAVLAEARLQVIKCRQRVLTEIKKLKSPPNSYSTHQTSHRLTSGIIYKDRHLC